MLQTRSDMCRMHELVLWFSHCQDRAGSFPVDGRRGGCSWASLFAETVLVPLDAADDVNTVVVFLFFLVVVRVAGVVPAISPGAARGASNRGARVFF